MTDHRCYSTSKECKRPQTCGRVVTVVLHNAPMRLMGALRGCFSSGSQFDLRITARHAHMHHTITDDRSVSSMDSTIFNRRTLLGSGALVGIGALLAACGQQANNEAAATASAAPSESASASAAASDVALGESATPSLRVTRGYSGRFEGAGWRVPPCG